MAKVRRSTAKQWTLVSCPSPLSFLNRTKVSTTVFNSQTRCLYKRLFEASSGVSATLLSPPANVLFSMGFFELLRRPLTCTLNPYRFIGDGAACFLFSFRHVWLSLPMYTLDFRMNSTKSCTHVFRTPRETLPFCFAVNFTGATVKIREPLAFFSSLEIYSLCTSDKLTTFEEVLRLPLQSWRITAKSVV